MLYATCSPVVEETAGVVAAVLAGRNDARLEDALSLVPAQDAESAHLAGAVQLWPHRHGTDAMFMALLRRELSERGPVPERTTGPRSSGSGESAHDRDPEPAHR